VWRAFAFYTAVVVYSLTAALVIGQDEKTSAVVPIVAFVAILAAIVVYDAELEGQVLKALTVGEERTFEQDPAFALRLFADIALRALSPAVNAPTTAVQALDMMDGLLRALGTRDLGVAQVAGSDGGVRVRLVLPSWHDYLAVALDEIIALPAVSPNVSRRILRLLDELAAITPVSRRSALEARRRQIHDPRRTPDLPAAQHHAGI